jgi:hypothetical protein
MPVPVINQTQSSLTFAVGQPFTFQFVATESPTSWSIGRHEIVPAGFMFNTASGVLTGTAQMPGIWLLTLTATNADGSSAPEVFCIGAFETGVSDLTKAKRYLGINTVSWEVSTDDPAPAGGTTLAAAIAQARLGDDLLFQINLLNSDTTPSSLELILAKMSVRALNSDDEPFFITDEGDFKITVSMVNGAPIQSYWLYASLNNQALREFMEDSNPSGLAEINATCELELFFKKPSVAPGPPLQRITTVPFLMRISEDTIR